MNDARLRRIWLCADDYGLAEGVNRAIRDLISRGRLNATSVMVVGAAIGRAEVTALQDVGGEPALRDRPARDADRAVSSADDALSAAQWRSVPAVSDHAAIGAVAAARSGTDRGRDARPTRGLQGAVRPCARFRRRPPACATLPAGARRLPARGEGSCPGAWVRQGGRLRRWPGCSARRRRWCSTCSARNSASAPPVPPSRSIRLAGAYDFSQAPDFGALMGEFLEGLPEGGLVMCHPGFVDETLRSLDPLTTQREAEHGFWQAIDSRHCWRRIKLH